MRRNLTLILLLTGLCIGKCSAQEESDRIQSRTATSLMRGKAANPALSAGKWKPNRLISSALARSVLVRPTGTTPVGDGGNAALIGLLRKQHKTYCLWEPALAPSPALATLRAHPRRGSC
jgi:hypothetical protein